MPVSAAVQPADCEAGKIPGSVRGRVDRIDGMVWGGALLGGTKGGSRRAAPFNGVGVGSRPTAGDDSEPAGSDRGGSVVH
ncbi:MAG: hypothetical protein AAFN74_18560, partial [Myxococcota bacterium]